MRFFLSFEFSCSIYIGIVHLKAAIAQTDAAHDIGNIYLFINTVAILKCIAVKESVSIDRAAI